MYVDDFDLGGIGFQVVDLQGWRDYVPHTDLTQQIPGRQGMHLLANHRVSVARRLVIDGLIVASSGTELRSFMEELFGRLSIVRSATDRLSVRFNDDPNRLFFCRPMSGSAGLTRPKLDPATRRTRVRFTLECPEPEVFQNSLTQITFDDNATEMTLDSAPVRPLITIPGPIVAPTVTYKNASGVALRSMIFSTLTLVSGESLEINCDSGLIELVVGSARTNYADFLDTGSDYIVLDPADGDIWATSPTYPTLQISPAPTNDPDAEYRRAAFS